MTEDWLDEAWRLYRKERRQNARHCPLGFHDVLWTRCVVRAARGQR